MMGEPKDTIWQDTIDKWGVALQIGTAMEECAELIAALNRHYIRGREPVEAVIEELADVELVCKQLRHIIGDEPVNLMVETKLRRLRAKVAEQRP